jgi:hypothetical protein
MWGSSQASTSLLFFLLQLTFLKSEIINHMVQFSILFGLFNFYLLGIRRSFLESKDWSKESSPHTFLLSCTFIYLLICAPLTLFFSWDLRVLFTITALLYLQLLLDAARFNNQKGHLFFVSTQIFLSFSIAFTEHLNFSSISILSIVVLLNSFFLIVLRILNLNIYTEQISNNHTFSWSRFLDFSLVSGFGFLLPLITFIVLDSLSVGILRTSQNYLAIANLFTASYYYSALQNTILQVKFNISYLFPSSIMSIILVIINYYPNRSLIEKVFGPYIYSSNILTSLLIIALVPTIWVVNLNVYLIKLKLYKFLLNLHICTLLFFAISTILGYRIIGINAFGIATILSSILEVFILTRFIKVHNV